MIIYFMFNFIKLLKQTINLCNNLFHNIPLKIYLFQSQKKIISNLKTVLIDNSITFIIF